MTQERPASEKARSDGPPVAQSITSIAFYYGAQIPVDELAAFDAVVLEPEHALAMDRQIVQRLAPHTIAAAYLSLGEIAPSRSYAAELPAGLVLANNPDWQSWVIDQTHPDWSRFLSDKLISPYWDAGFRVFFLDTLDSYLLIESKRSDPEKQRKALRSTLQFIQRRFPGIRFIFNRGFELIDEQLAPSILALAAESLFRRWNARDSRFEEITEQDRGWLLDRVTEVRQRYGLPIIMIDYCPADDRELTRLTARRIIEAGFIPWVSEPKLMSLGVSSVEVIPRKVLLLHSNPGGNDPDLTQESAHLYGALPLEYYGYVPEYRYLGEDFTFEGSLTGRYAAVVMWSTDSEIPDSALSLLRQARAAQIPCLLLGYYKASFLSDFGLRLGPRLVDPLRIEQASHVPPGELLPLIKVDTTYELNAAEGSEIWVSVVGHDGRRMDAAAITPWGGYALGSFSVHTPPGQVGSRWAIEPIEFFRRALRVDETPMPDVTTRCGRRVFFVHFDSDGWVNACERPGSPIAGEVLVREYIEVYRTPVLGSAIVAELAEDGLYPHLSQQGQNWARRLFALPFVEAGSHSWSHPFIWTQALGEARRKPRTNPTYGIYLPLRGYTLDLATEIEGSQRWIEKHLLPAGKTCTMFLWSGDCDPPASAVARVYASGMGNINGGGTTIMLTANTLCRVWPMAIPKGRHWQVYAPMSNEMDYTNLWRGPYSGFERAIETFELTDTPRRLKPLNLYFHSFLITKPAGANSLHKLWRWCLQQPIHPIYASQYVASVLAWQKAVVARRHDGTWLLRAPAALKQWRQPLPAPLPDLARSFGLAGYNEHAQMRYLHTVGTQTIIQPGTRMPSAQLRLIDANAEVIRWDVSAQALFAEFSGHAPLDVRLEMPRKWRAAEEKGSPWQSTRLTDSIYRFQHRESRAVLRLVLGT